MRLPMPADRCVDKPPPGLVKAPLQSTPAQVAELVDALASGASGRKVVKVRVLSWAPFVLPRTSGDVQKMAEIRHFPCYNRPVKSGRIRHQSVTMGVYPGVRSEEHTSELQSLMRISYAVFCLKKKKHQKTR